MDDVKWKYILLLIALSIQITLNAQNITGERRVYYLDATYSMVKPNKLWEPCKKNLIKAIENIEDNNTELVVVVFADDKNPNKKVWKEWEEKATSAGKDKLIHNIEQLSLPVKSSMTNLYDPWMDFYSQTKSDKVNYMFLMTDGEHEQGGNFIQAIDKWSQNTSHLTYGFFVELTNLTGPLVEDAREHIAVQPRLWRVSSADVNINLIRLESAVTFNIRNDKYIDIPIYFSGKDKGAIRNLKIRPNNADFKITKTDFSEDAIRVYIDSNVDIYNYPTNSTISLTVELKGADDKTILLTNKVNVKCVNKKERTLFLSDSRIRGKVKHYDSFGWVEASTIPYTTTIDLDFNIDAQNDARSFVEFTAVDNNGKILSPSIVAFTLNGTPCKGNKIRVTPEDKSAILSITFPNGTKDGVYQGYLKPTRYHLERIGNIELGSASVKYPLSWRVRYTHSMNPLKKGLMWLCILIATALSLWFIVLKPILHPCFPKFRKMVLVKVNNAVVAQFTVNFKGAKRIVFANKKQHQGLLNRLFTGKIDTVVNPIFEEPITFIPKKKNKALVKGKGYLVVPNPIPQSGVAEISAPTKKLYINLQ